MVMLGRHKMVLECPYSIETLDIEQEMWTDYSVDNLNFAQAYDFLVL